MKSYSVFSFDSYEIRGNEVLLRYSLDDEVEFEEKLILPADYMTGVSADLNRMIFALHLIGGISYFKTCLPKKIEIRSGTLTKKEAAFWNELYEKGLGEFFYRNKIDFRGLIEFPVGQRTEDIGQRTNELPQVPAFAKATAGRPSPKSQVLVPIGGGKDSLVTIDLLQKAGYNITLLRMGRHPIIEQMVEKLGLPCITIERRLSPRLFALNAVGALNGHIPITAYLSFAALVVAELGGFEAVVMSSECSANIGNMEFHGMEINHQWSKGLDFERMLQTYVRESIGSPIAIFSLLRPFSELTIAKLFAEQKKFLPLATSCNTNWKILGQESHVKRSSQRSDLHMTRKADNGGATLPRSGFTWCGHCPKCAFVFALFAAFLPVKEVASIFRKNLFADPVLLPLYRELLGLEGFKPFECVGTPEETQAAFLLARKRGDAVETPVMKMFEQECLPKIKNPEQLIKAALAHSNDRAIPPEFEKVLSKL